MEQVCRDLADGVLRLETWANHVHSWNTFKIDINQDLIEQTAERLVSSGLRDVGYEYLVIDAGWQNLSRATDGRQQANETNFPDGMAALGQTIHSHGLKYGIYSDAGLVNKSA